MMLNESDTRAKLIDPILHSRGWTENLIRREETAGALQYVSELTWILFLRILDEHDRDFVAAHQLTDGADEVFVNGDSLIPGAQSLDPIFKERMFSEVEV